MIILRIGSVLGEKFKILEIGPCAGSDRVGGRGLNLIFSLWCAAGEKDVQIVVGVHPCPNNTGCNDIIVQYWCTIKHF